MKTQAQAIRAMSDIMIQCELRSAWGEVECNIRHGLQATATMSTYIVALTAEQTKRAAR